MKSMKKLLAAVLSVAMIGSLATVSYAATLDYTNKIEFSATVSPATVAPGEDVTISFYMKDITNNETLTMSAGGTYGVDFAVNENFTYKSAAIGQDFGSESLGNAPVNGYYVTLLEPSLEAAVTADAPIFTYVFTVNADATAGTYDVITGWSGAYVGDGDGYDAGDYSFDASAAKVTVTGGGNEEVTATKTAGGENVDYDTYTFENLEEGSALTGKKVLMQKAAVPTTGMTADTRFIVSNGTRTQIFGGDIWSRLGAEGDGVIDVANVIFGLIVPADNTDTFTFTVE